MRIIKEGKIPEEIECKCEVCGCVFAYTKNDVEFSRYTRYPDYWVTCPTCDNQIEVEKYPEYKN